MPYFDTDYSVVGNIFAVQLISVRQKGQASSRSGLVLRVRCKYSASRDGDSHTCYFFRCVEKYLSCKLRPSILCSYTRRQRQIIESFSVRLENVIQWTAP